MFGSSLVDDGLISAREVWVVLAFLCRFPSLCGTAIGFFMDKTVEVYCIKWQGMSLSLRLLCAPFGGMN